MSLGHVPFFISFRLKICNKLRANAEKNRRIINFNCWKEEENKKQENKKQKIGGYNLSNTTVHVQPTPTKNFSLDIANKADDVITPGNRADISEDGDLAIFGLHLKRHLVSH